MNLPATRDASSLSQSDLSSLMNQADLFIKSGLLPRTVDTPEKAIAIMLKGREAGMPPMHAFSHINVINGKPTLSAEVMLALIRKNCPRAEIHFIERNNEKCRIAAARKPGDPMSEFTFTMDDARRAELLKNPSWAKYPRAMCHARAVSEMARSMFPDAIAGISYTPEEMGAVVDGEGAIISLPVAEPEKPKQVAEVKPAQPVTPQVQAKPQTPQQPGDGPTPKQLSRLYAIAKSKNLEREIDRYTYAKFNVMRGSLTQDQYKHTCTYFENGGVEPVERDDEQPPPPLDIDNIPF